MRSFTDNFLRYAAAGHGGGGALSPGGGGGGTIAKATLDGAVVVEVLRAAGALRSAAASSTALKTQKRLAPLLTLDICGVDESTAAFSVWKEKPPVGPAARGGAAAKARFLDAALSDRYITLPPGGLGNLNNPTLLALPPNPAPTTMTATATLSASAEQIFKPLMPAPVP